MCRREKALWGRLFGSAQRSQEVTRMWKAFHTFILLFIFRTSKKFGDSILGRWKGEGQDRWSCPPPRAEKKFAVSHDASIGCVAQQHLHSPLGDARNRAFLSSWICLYICAQKGQKRYANCKCNNRQRDPSSCQPLGINGPWTLRFVRSAKRVSHGRAALSFSPWAHREMQHVGFRTRQHVDESETSLHR